MVFSGLPFLYFFLPAVLITYFLVPKVLKNTVLLVFSLVFYAWGEPKMVFLMIFTIAMFYGCGLAIGASNRNCWKRFWLILSIVVSVALFGVFKYANFFVYTFGQVTGISTTFLRIALPVGISFYTFQCLSYTIDVYRGNVPAQKNPLTFGAYVVLFPQLIAGPIVRYVDVARELEHRTHSLQNVGLGLRRFIVGLSKKIILADNFALLMEIFRNSEEQSVLFAWMYAIAFTLYIYFDFSGYSDMAIGLGRILGFRFVENFNYPYISKSVSEFWRRWHMSLGTWFRDYVYIPLGGNRVKRWRWVFNTLVVWLLTGFWHGAAWNFICWGLLYAGMLLLEKFVPAIQKLPSVLRHFYVLLVVVLGFVMFNATDNINPATDPAGAMGFGTLIYDLKAMFGLGGLPGVTAETLYYLRSYAVLFIVGFVGATPLVRNLCRKVEQYKITAILEPVVLLILLLVCTGYLVDGSFSPFMYFRF